MPAITCISKPILTVCEGITGDYYPEGSTKRAITGNGGIWLA